MCPELITDGGALPLSRHRIVATTRDEEAADTLSRFLMPLRISRVAEPRRFRLDMNGCRLGRIFIGFNQFATDTVVEPERIEDALVFSLGYDHRRPSFVELDDERVPVSTESAVVISPTRHVRNFRPGQSGAFILGMPTKVLEDRYREITGMPVRAPMVFRAPVDLTTGSGRLLRELTHALATQLECVEPGSGSRLRHALLEDALISVLLDLPGTHSGAREIDPEQDLAPWLVRRAEDYMAAHAADPITLSDLVSVCGCSRSALFAAFKSSRSYAPMQFLTGRRLELARDRLMGEPEATATEIALDCGFGNHGRFAKAYSSRFGESPSATRARCHGPMRL